MAKKPSKLLVERARPDAVLETWRLAGSVSQWLVDQAKGGELDFSSVAEALQDLGTELALLVLLEVSNQITVDQRGQLAKQLAIAAMRSTPKQRARLRELVRKAMLN